MEEANEIEHFGWYYKDYFKKNSAYFSGNIQERQTFLRATQDLNHFVIVKKIKIRINDNDNTNNFKKILREIYFLACCKKNRYFAEIIDVFLSEDSNHVFIILKEEGADLKDFIEYEPYYKQNILSVSRSIIFDVVSGLKILHKNGLSHNDIKPSNIVVSDSLKAKICDMGSTNKDSKICYSGTRGYYSPQALLGKPRTKEDDMWSIGVVYLELLKKKVGKFIIESEDHIENLKNLLNFYNIELKDKKKDVDIYDQVINYIKNNDYNSFEYELKSVLFININNEDKELIQKLLEIDPKKRLKAEELLNSPVFSSYKLIKSQLNYSDKDYERYINEAIADRNTFLKYLEEIKEKFIGRELFP